MSATGGKPRIEIEPRPLADPGSLARAVLDGDAPLDLPLLSRSEGQPDSALRPARLGADAFGTSGSEVRGRLDAVLRGEGFFVSTGHQPILLLGPWYVLHKILTAISLAGRLESQLGLPVLPLFWIAADDHDWAEVGRATLLDRADRPRRFGLPVPEGGERRSVGPHTLDASSLSILDDLDDVLVESSFTDHYLTLVRDAYREGTTVSQAFARLLRGVLGDRGYVWIDAGRSEVRRAAAPFYRRLVHDAARALDAEDAGRRAVAGAGFAPPITAVEGALPLFFDSGEGRRRVAGAEGDAAETWRARLEATPERFSPNVASRPLLESYLLPVLATVLGPGEVAYWSQLVPLFDALDVPFPQVEPRASWTLLEPRIRRILDRAAISPQDLAAGPEPIVGRLTREARPEGIDRALHKLRADTEASLADVDRAVADELPGLRAAAGKARKSILGATDDLSRLVDRATRERLDVRLGQVRRAAANLFPGGRPQERVLNPLPLLCRYGPDLIHHLASDTDRHVVDRHGPG